MVPRDCLETKELQGNWVSQGLQGSQGREDLKVALEWMVITDLRETLGSLNVMSCITSESPADVVTVRSCVDPWT